MKMEITTTATEDDIKHALEENLSVPQLINFAIDLGDNLSNADEYYNGLYKRLHRMRAD